jgi:hypothetical protein
MILNNDIKVKNSNKYKKLGYDSTEEYIFIDIKHLSESSRIEIDVKCDYCDTHKKITYKDYNNNIKKCNKYACSIKCGRLKSKETNLEKYGVEWYVQTKDFEHKRIETNLEKYGVEHISSSDIIKEKFLKKCLIKKKIYLKDLKYIMKTYLKMI